MSEDPHSESELMHTTLQHHYCKIFGFVVVDMFSQQPAMFLLTKAKYFHNIIIWHLSLKKESPAEADVVL